MKNFHHGKRSQDLCLSFVEERVNLCMDGDSPLQSMLKLTKDEHKVPIRGLRNWRNHFIAWGKYSRETGERKTRLKKVKKRLKQSRTATNDLGNSLKHIVGERPVRCLDENQMAACTSLKGCAPMPAM